MIDSNDPRILILRRIMRRTFLLRVLKK